MNQINVKLKPYKLIDLFCGMGGVRRGFELAGCKCVLSADIDERAIKQYKHLYGDNCENDVTTEEFKDKCKIDYDILCGGFPCQSFSYMGDMKGFLNKTKGTLFFDCADILQRTRPKAFMFENVKGLLTHDKGKTFNTIFQVLTELDYKLVGFTDYQQELNCVSYKESKNIIRNSKEFGLPQSRTRVYIVGFDKRRYGNLLKDNYELPKGRDVIYTVEDIINSVPDNEFIFKPMMVYNVRQREKKWDRIYIMNPIKERVFSCLATKDSAMGFDVIQTKYGERLISIRERAMLQGFQGYGFMENGVDKFSWEKSLSYFNKIFLTGNSVTIPVIEEIGKFIVNELDRLEIEKKDTTIN